MIFSATSFHSSIQMLSCARTACDVLVENKIVQILERNTRPGAAIAMKERNDILILCKYCIWNVSMRFDNLIFIFHCTHQQFCH